MCYADCGMTSDEPRDHPASKILRIVVPLLGSDVLEVVSLLWRLTKRILSLKVHEGLYEVLDYETRLELLDTNGEKAVLHKRERVRLLQSNIIAYQDQAWGDGEIFADYKCSPGVAVDRCREGHRVRVLISLRTIKNRDDVEEFRIERTIGRGFTKAVEDLQIDIDHTTRRFSISVVFPRQRFPKHVALIERNATRSIPLTNEHQLRLPDGRQQWTWSTDKARLFEAYILRWEW